MSELITGGTGLVGRALLRELPAARVTSRDPKRAAARLGHPHTVAWNPSRQTLDPAAFKGVDVVFHLLGEPVASGRWTEAKKQRIRESRVLGTRRLVASLMACRSERPKVLVQASAVGFYGDQGDTQLDETSPSGTGFLAEVCRDWEGEALAAQDLGIRVVCARLGIVLAASGGALERMITPFKLGLGGRVGDGKQWMPWIHLDDVVGLLLHASRHAELSGPLNVVAPEPVTNGQFTRALARTLHRPALLHVPKPALRLALGDMSELLTASQRVLPQRASETGYTFRYPLLDDALQALLGPTSSPSRPNSPSSPKPAPPARPRKEG